MPDYRGLLAVAVIIVVMSFIFLNVVIPEQEETTPTTQPSKTITENTITITPSTEVGKGIRTLEDDNKGYLASITDENGEIFYFNNRTTVLTYHEHVKGNYSTPFTVQYRNATVNGINNSHIITKIL